MASTGDQEKRKNALLEAKNKKTMKRKHEEALRSEVNIDKPLVNDDEAVRSPHFQGPIG